MEAEAAAVLADFQRLLVAGGVLAGYASFDDPTAPRLLLHPSDRETGIRYSALAMVHAIIDELFTPEQAAAPADLIARELSGPDGLRLFDRPLAYRGGPMTLFQRGESASYFGREIGLMYMHAHLRWAEALAQLGRGDDLLHALRLANPIGLQALVPSAAPRQANCYHSSSDAAFADRYQAATHYDRIARGEVALEGGWRIYSSGAGIAWRLVVQRLLGFTQQVHRLLIDPVLPPSLDGLQATVELYGLPVEVTYRAGPHGHGPTAVRLNGGVLAFIRGSNRYRDPGVEVAVEDWRALLAASGNALEITLG
jgi:CRISPR-associated protein Csx3